MESAEFVVAVASAREVDRARRPGRFSAGLEHMPETAANLRVGRFSTGVEQLDEAAAHVRVGRFSAGTEQAPDTPAKQRVGEFSDCARSYGVLDWSLKASLLAGTALSTTSLAVVYAVLSRRG